MFTSHGNIRRKRKGPQAPPKPSSDRITMKKLRDERIRQAAADERNPAQAHHNADHEDHSNNQHQPVDDSDDGQDPHNEEDGGSGGHRWDDDNRIDENC